METCKKNALKFKVKANVGNLQEECFTSLKSKQTLETCKKNALKFKVKVNVGNLQEECFKV